MKFHLVLIALAINYCCYSQNNFDSLNKFSYRIYGNCTNGVKCNIGGSVFFIRTDKSLYLITAKHCLTGCDHGKHEDNFPDTMWLETNDKDFYLDVKEIKDTAKCDNNDFFILKIDTSIGRHVNSIENLIPTSISNYYYRMKLVGYPKSSYKIDTAKQMKYFLKRQSMNILLMAPDFYLEPLHEETIKRFNSTTTRVVCSSRLIKQEELHGYSGSPAFFQDYMGKWVVLGCFHAGGWGADPDFTSIYLENISSIMENIKRID